MYEIGQIINTHGLDGDILVRDQTDFKELFNEGQRVYAEMNGKIKQFTIKKQRIHKQYQLIRFKNYESIDVAERLKGLVLKVKQEQLPELKEDEFHYHEIINCDVYTMENKKIGKVTEILAPGANDVWVVHNDEGKEFLIPAITDVIEKVNAEEKLIIIKPMEGLLD